PLFTTFLPPSTLIEALLQRESTRRIGFDCDDSVLRRHAFFKGIDFARLREQPPPGWRMPTAAETETLPTQSPSFSSVDSDVEIMSGRIRAEEEEEGTHIRVVEAEETSTDEEDEDEDEDRWRQFCLQDENIVLHGRITKDGVRTLFRKTRVLILTDLPRLFYVDDSRMQFKGEVPFTRDTHAEVRDPDNFFVRTPDRTYKIKALERSAADWVTAIENMRDRLR
ncbi:MAG: hypothetical protein MHM6MM_004219, partial [Cercozoa sp. M6MM]